MSSRQKPWPPRHRDAGQSLTAGRQPEQTALYQVLQEDPETALALAGEDDWDGQRVPVYVQGEFRRYLECGVLAYGFARARCPQVFT